MPVAINTFVILGGLMNKDNVVATLKQNAIVRRNFTDVCIKKVNDLNYCCYWRLRLSGVCITVCT